MDQTSAQLTVTFSDSVKDLSFADFYAAYSLRTEEAAQAAQKPTEAEEEDTSKE